MSEALRRSEVWLRGGWEVMSSKTKECKDLHRDEDGGLYWNDASFYDDYSNTPSIYYNVQKGNQPTKTCTTASFPHPLSNPIPLHAPNTSTAKTLLPSPPSFQTVLLGTALPEIITIKFLAIL